MIEKFDSITINNKESIRDAIKKLDNYSEKILFVIDDENHLIGSLTDGDIRRWILWGGNDFNTKVDNACFKKTFFVRESIPLEKENFISDEIRDTVLKKKINFVPVVSDSKVIIKILTWDDLFSETQTKNVKEKINLPVIIMAGGKGTRLDPFTRVLPKPLIPIGDKTVVEIIIDKFLVYGVNIFFLSLNHKANIIKSYFEELTLPYRLNYIEENLPLGTAGSLRLIQNKISENIFVTNCDILVDADYFDLSEFHKSKNYSITIVASLKHFNIPYGICEISDGGALKKITEKPEYSFLVNTGMYVLKSEVLNLIPPDKAFDMTDLINAVISSGGKVGVYPISEKSWIDIGEWSEYKKALEALKI
ncbi:MAG: nucleotidyltransferase family protein [Ignavibacteriaceae bacterium]